jgi:GNAT superfamily N-acetyltransferase
MDQQVVRYSQRPELWADTKTITREVWPEYNLHSEDPHGYWDRLFDEFPEFQFVLYDYDAKEVIAEGHTVPCDWDGTAEGLGEGIDTMLAAAFEARAAGRAPTALCALAAEVRPQFQGGGLANRMLDVMSEIGREAGLTHLIAPVRPSLKDRYPITPIEQYVPWTRDNGEPFDPWIRIHTRRGGQIAKPIPRSMRITGTVSEWEEWTQMQFPGDGSYTFPGGLATLEIDHGADRGSYWEPNVWIIHRLQALDVARDDSVRLRRATIADAEPLALGVIEGVADYPSFAPPGWTAPSLDAELEHLHEALADPDLICLVAEAEGALVGQITLLPAAHAPHPVEDPSLGHISNLFVRRDHWGTGVAAQLHSGALDAAAARGFKELRLFVAAGQARARRFYEREGWRPASDPFDDPTPGLTMIEYRYRPHDQ